MSNFRLISFARALGALLRSHGEGSRDGAFFSRGTTLLLRCAAVMSLCATLSALPAYAIDKLDKTDTVIGKGAEAVKGRLVVVNYTGWLYDEKAARLRGRQFDSSVGRGPFSFPLGAGRVIKGWDDGVEGMRVGGKRTLIIPSRMAYGANGAGGVIPPNADLIFDVELLEVR